MSEDAQAAAEAVEDIDKDVTTSQREFAYKYITALFSVVGISLVGGFVGGIYYNHINPRIVINATVNVGWVIEYIVAFMVFIFMFVTLAMVLIALPVSILQGMIKLAGGIYEASQE